MYNESPRVARTRLQKSVVAADWPVYVAIQANGLLQVGRHDDLPEHVVDSLFRLRQQGFIRFDAANFNGRWIQVVNPRIEGEAPGNLDLPEQWRAWECMQQGTCR
jgi:hypothetical protein